jgi:flagellar biosynthesis protein FlhF
MQVYRVSGRDLDEALRHARAAYGDEALVLGQEEEGGRVTLAVARGEAPRQAPRKRRSVAERVLPVAAPESEAVGDTREVRARLAAAGASGALVEAVCREVSGGAKSHPIDAAAAAIGRRFLVARSPRVAGKTRVITFVGPTGAGKTLSLAKLGLQLKQAGRKVAFAAPRARRVGALEQAQAYADLIEVPLHVVDPDARISERTFAASKAEAVLFDVPGCSPADDAALEDLRLTLSRVGADLTLDRYLVLPASASASALRVAERTFAPLAPSGCVITKLDETAEPGPVLELALRRRLAVAFLCDGTDVAKHLHRASADRFSDLLLRGRIS